MRLNCKRCWILFAVVSLRSNLMKSAKNQIVRLKSVRNGYRGRIFWYRPSLLPACARMKSFVLLCILKGEKACFGDDKNENVSVSPLTRADKADIASMVVKPRASFTNGWGLFGSDYFSTPRSGGGNRNNRGDPPFFPCPPSFHLPL